MTRDDAQTPPAETAGIIRPPNRPPGWLVPGPAPRTPADRPDLWPGPGEDLCHLTGDFRILQHVTGHRWTMDDLVTAYHAARAVGGAEPRTHVDLGCGIGTVLLILAWRFPAVRSVGIEVQDLSAGLAARSVAWNGVDDRVSVRHADFREAVAAGGLGPVDLVTGTPPYFPVGTGTESVRPQCGPCRFEYRGGVEDYAATAARLLAPGAPFVVCGPARDRDRDRAIAAAAAAGLHLRAWHPVIPREGKPPLIAVCEMRREDGPTVESPPIVVRDLRGHWTDGWKAVRAEMGLPPPTW